MKLKRLIIQGFKSFKDRTVINFDDGITGVVGPNGCGKSNIVDAFFWVTGGQSAKHIRSNTMKDVIFAGSAKYNPGAWAEVSLVMENIHGKHIHISNKVFNPSEIQLTRKLYRNGETEYRINGSPCRLKDIQELFMDTGAGAKSYSVIAQGEVARLIDSKPEERWAMVEEVAGITKFKLRKKESLRKIDQTQTNLHRLADLQVEIEKNMRSLQKQAEKAEKAKTLKERLERNDLIVSSHKVYDFLKKYREGKNFLNEKKIELENSQVQKNVLEVELENDRVKKEDLSAKVELLQKDYNEISRKLAAAEERLNYLNRSSIEKRELVVEREKEIDELKEEIISRGNRISELRQEKDTLEERGREGYDFSGLEEKVENLKDELELRQNAVEELKEEIERKKEEFQEVNQESFNNSARLEELSNTLQDTSAEIELLENQFSGVSVEISKKREAVNDSQLELQNLEKEESTLKEKINSLSDRFKEVGGIQKEKSKEIICFESKLNALKEINSSLEGVNEGTAQFLKSDEGAGLELFGNLVQCDPEHTKAVQGLLSELMEVIMLSDDKLEVLSSWHQNNKDKKLEMFLGEGKEVEENSETIERLKLAFEINEEIVPLKEVIRIDEKFSTTLQPFMEGYYVVLGTIDNALEKVSKVSSQINFKAITNLAGDFLLKNVGDGKIITLSGVSEDNQGMVARNNKILELEGAVLKAKEILEKNEEAFDSIESELEADKDKYEEIRNQLSDAKANYAVTKSALEMEMAGLKTGNARLDILKSRKNEVSKSRLSLLEKEEELGSKIDISKKDLEEKSERHDELFEEFTLVQSSYTAEKEELMQLKAEEKVFDDRMRSLVSQIDDIETTLEKQESRLQTNQQLIEKYNGEIVESETEAKKLKEENQAVSTDLIDRESVLNVLKDDLGELLLGMQDNENEVKRLTGSINRAEKKIVEYDIKLEQYQADEAQVVRNIFEKYRVDLRKSVGSHLEYEEEDYKDLVNLESMFISSTEEGSTKIEVVPYEFVRRYGNDLRECEQKLNQYKNEYYSLGEINWQAIEDYKRQKLRFDFLREQEQELKESLIDLQTAIEHIDEKSKKRFHVAFEEINSRFRKVFPVIFGGGDADLKLQGSIDALDQDGDAPGIEIMARPPGKKMQSIKVMSGGEKTLTAISLIFSIFLVKPSPFCLLDEVDAALDDSNVGRLNELLREMSVDSQFILITHNKKTMEMNDVLYGVTMEDPGVSKVVSVQLQ